MCCVLSNKIKYICLMQNESNCSAAHHIKQIIMKNSKAWEHRRIFINWIWVRACDPCVMFTGKITQTALTLHGFWAFTEKTIQFKNAHNRWLSGSEQCSQKTLSPCCCLSRQFLHWILWIQITTWSRKTILNYSKYSYDKCKIKFCGNSD